LFGCLSRWRGYCAIPFDITSPDEPPPVIISHRMYVEEFCFEGFEILVIQAKSDLEGWIRDPSLAFQEGDDLIEQFIKRHGFYSPNRAARS
jgi:hypothetical protein